MAQATVVEALEVIESRVPEPSELRELRTKTLADPNACGAVETRVRELSAAGAIDDAKKAALAGLLAWAIGDHRAARELLANGGRSVTVRWAYGRALLEGGRVADAIGVLEPLAGSREDDVEIVTALAEAHCRAGDTSAAAAVLKGKARAFAGSPDYHCLLGWIQDILGDRDGAQDEYDKALDIDEDHAPTLFRLGYAADLRGEDEEAEEYYRRCVDRNPPLVNAMMNLGVMCEDAGRYDEAIKLYRAVTNADPANARARMYYIDARSSVHMIYDEDMERKEDRRAQILNIPVSDFELSVRSRNCLVKMQIDTLGDLVQKSEAELLSYKNFGETSLQEIKDILAQKGLRLGMGADDIRETMSMPTITLSSDPTALDPSVRDRSIDDLELSVRSRNAMTALGVRTVGELCDKTETELLACKNFGQTSMNEVKEKLAEFGVSLKSSS